MPDNPTMPHDPERTGEAAPPTRPPCPSGRATRPVPPEAEQALADARAATDAVRTAREQMTVHADHRRQAVLRASRAGASYRRIACELGVSAGIVQQLVASAKDREPTT